MKGRGLNMPPDRVEENEAPGPSQERASAMATIRPRCFWAHGARRPVVESPVGVAATTYWMKGIRPKRDKVEKRGEANA